MRISALTLFFLLAVPFASAHLSSAGGSASVFFEHEPPQAGVNETIWVWITNGDGKPVTEPDIVHERRVHNFIVGSDGETFTHFHPEEFADGFDRQAAGLYTLHYLFPAAGEYLLIADYTEKGINYLQPVPFTVQGSPSLQPSRSDEKRIARVGEHEIELDIPTMIIAGNETAADFIVRQNGQDVTDLQMLLGAEVHVFYVSENLSFAEHTHAYRAGHYLHTGVMTQKYTGPRVPVRFTFPDDGLYFIFAQFQREGEVITASFRVRVGDERPSLLLPAALIVTGIIAAGSIIAAVSRGFRRRQR